MPAPWKKSAKEKVKAYWIDQGKSEEEAEEIATRYEKGYAKAWGAEVER